MAYLSEMIGKVIVWGYYLVFLPAESNLGISLTDWLSEDVIYGYPIFYMGLSESTSRWGARIIAHKMVASIASRLHEYFSEVAADVETGGHDDVIKWKYFPRYWPFVRGIHRSPVNSPHNGE